MKQKTSNQFGKAEKNYRSMTSLMNRPSLPRKYSVNKSKYAYVCNNSSSFASKCSNEPQKEQKSKADLMFYVRRDLLFFGARFQPLL